MSRPSFLAGAALAAVFANNAAWAGSAVPELGNPKVEATRRIGIEASVGVKHESNIARSDQSLASQRGLVPADERLSPDVDTDIMLPFGAHYVQLTGNGRYEIYRRNSRLNHAAIAADPKFGLDFGRCRTDLAGGYARRQSDLSEAGATLPSGIDSVRNIESTLSASAAGSCGGAVGLRPSLSVKYVHATNDNPRRSPIDFDTTVYAAGIGYEHPAIGNILFFASRNEVRFPRQLLPAGGENGYNMRHFGAKFVRKIGSRLQGEFEVTYEELDARATADPALNGLNWNFDLTATATPRLTLHGEFSREIANTLTTAALFHRDTSTSLDASYTVSSRTTAKLGYATVWRRFAGTSASSTTVSSGPLLTSDRRTSYSGSLSYDLSPRFSVTFEAERETRHANDRYFAYANNQFGLSLVCKLGTDAQGPKG